MVLMERDRAESRSRQPLVDYFATILPPAQNFLATIWPLIEILRSLVAFHRHETVHCGSPMMDLAICERPMVVSLPRSMSVDLAGILGSRRVDPAGLVGEAG